MVKSVQPTQGPSLKRRDDRESDGPDSQKRARVEPCHSDSSGGEVEIVQRILSGIPSAPGALDFVRHLDSRSADDSACSPCISRRSSEGLVSVPLSVTESHHRYHQFSPSSPAFPPVASSARGPIVTAPCTPHRAHHAVRTVHDRLVLHARRSIAHSDSPKSCVDPRLAPRIVIASLSREALQHQMATLCRDEQVLKSELQSVRHEYNMRVENILNAAPSAVPASVALLPLRPLPYAPLPLSSPSPQQHQQHRQHHLRIRMAMPMHPPRFGPPAYNAMGSRAGYSPSAPAAVACQLLPPQQLAPPQQQPTASMPMPVLMAMAGEAHQQQGRGALSGGQLTGSFPMPVSLPAPTTARLQMGGSVRCDAAAA